MAPANPLFISLLLLPVTTQLILSSNSTSTMAKTCIEANPKLSFRTKRSGPVVVRGNVLILILVKSNTYFVFGLSRDMNSKEYIEKLNKYEADHICRVMAKYFSDKDIYGGNVFDKSVTIDGETIKASRWHFFHSYADPVQFLEDESSFSSTSPADSSTLISNGTFLMRDG
ncbi:hypothetical protein TEA_020102 [Camellia sinensis var. sinensis]|uniref:Uncharacterized protein n=1 Tax=Camellia sinensis var. sinensis TaxID=542762 RepID=A0A4S4D7Z3_CAMSN|nr:hypothetical protein TEA_020102 [Camellia sinensis var. sinensis]